MVSLMEMFAAIADPRDPKGLRHPLEAILSLTVVAMLAGHTTFEAIAQFGRDHGETLAWALGFRRGKTPAKSTFSVVFRQLDAKEFEATLRAWILARHKDDWQTLNLDGKTARGSHDSDVPAVHLVSAYANEVSAVVGQIAVDNKTNEHKAA
ncbi:MAG: ISAs1 family transposase [Gemmataceae bacterium]